MRTRIVVISVIVVASAATALAYHRRDAGTMKLVDDETARIAEMLSKQDRDAMLRDRQFVNRSISADMLLRSGSAMVAGYRITAIRNGEQGYTLLSKDDVTHVGIIRMPAETVHLGFRLDRETGELIFVLASFSTTIGE